MKQEFIIKDGNETLLIFFAGWGMDSTPFAGYRPQGCDLLICYDYSDDTFNAAPLKEYVSVKVVAWSLGVWMAARTLSAAGVQPDRAIAINGTMHPVDSARGIAPEIYQGTLNSLADATLMKFRRRMCGGAAGYKEFIAVEPQRTLPSLKSELAGIGEKYAASEQSSSQSSSQPVGFRWDEAVVGEADAIFPATAQQAAWSEAGVKITAVDAPHYKQEIFKHYLEEIWIKD